MGCGESKHAVATVNTTVTKNKSKRSDSDNNPPLQNASNEPVNVKANEIPSDAIFIKKEAETMDNGKENTLANQENIGNGESGEGNPKTSSDKKKEGDGACGEEEEESIESVASGENDPATKNEEGLSLVTNTPDENKVSTSVGEDETHVGDKENANATSTTNTKAN